MKFNLRIYKVEKRLQKDTTVIAASKRGPQLLMENLSLRLFWKHMQIVSLHNNFHLLRRGHRAASFATESRRRPEMASQLIYSVARLINYFLFKMASKIFKNSFVLTTFSNENDNVPKIYTWRENSCHKRHISIFVFSFRECFSCEFWERFYRENICHKARIESLSLLELQVCLDACLFCGAIEWLH